LDEVGRGTSTYDGLSLAWAIVEYLHRDDDCGPKTLFATHYHELTKLAQILPRVKNFHVEIKEFDDVVLFLRKVVPGATYKSYGIQVARLSGIPLVVIARATEILHALEDGKTFVKNILHQKYGEQSQNEPTQSPQIDLF
jgi:DNA mismatch repair protein MutS